ncbi:hypothetical protein GMI70_09470 [Eggerthellaceae bacterium zg-893]|nr:hypothetical protein [Eggerthellaceae bacterium zg-893]
MAAKAAEGQSEKAMTADSRNAIELRRTIFFFIWKTSQQNKILSILLGMIVVAIAFGLPPDRPLIITKNTPIMTHW